MLGHLFVLGLVLLPACPLRSVFADALRGPHSSAVAPSKIEELRATQIGIDRSTNLWAYDRRTGELRSFSAAGDSIDSIDIGAASRVAYDQEWGTLWLDASGQRLGFRRPGAGATVEEIRLEQDFGDVAWLGADQIALSPRRAGHRVEIWDLKQGRTVAKWGKEEAIDSRRPGTIRLRTVWLRYDFEKERLFTLESFSGRLEVFDRDGQLLVRAQLPDRDGHKLEGWLRSTDAQNRSEGDTEEVSLHQWPSFVVDAEGQVWVPNRCKLEGERAELEMIVIPWRNEPRRTTVKADSSGCCALTAIRWGGWWIPYRDSSSPGSGCVGTWPIRDNGG